MRSLGFSIALIIVAAACSSSPSSDSSSSTDGSGGGGNNNGNGNAPPGTNPANPSQPGNPPPGTPPGTPPDIVPGTVFPPLLVGRLDTSDPAGPKASWPGVRIIARFDGTAVSVKFSEFAAAWMDGAPSYWEVSIDKGPWTPLAMISDNQPHVFELAKNLPKGPHEVELYKRSETQTGITQFLGLDFHGGQSLPSPAPQARKIEVMGDSFATGFGVEKIDAPDTVCPGANHGGVYENFRKSWGALLGVMFDAQVHGIVYSGKGLLKNIWPTDTDPLRDFYPRADPNPEIAHSAQLFDLQSWIPDVIILTNGSCDFDGSGSVSVADFNTAYRDFVVNRLRARGPNTHIFMGVVGNGARGEVSNIADQIVAERAAVGDLKMHRFLAKPYTWEEMKGCYGHGTPAWHQRVADELATEIRAKVGWQ